MYQLDFPGGPSLPTAQRELADGMNRHWAAFATHGDPAYADLPAWPGLGTGHVQSLAPERIGSRDYVAEHSLDFWARMRGSPGLSVVVLQNAQGTATRPPAQ